MEVHSMANVLLLYPILLILLYATWFIYMQIQFWIWKVPPGPVGIPFLGYGPLLSAHPYKDLAHLSKIYGKIFTVTIAYKHFVIVSDYDTAKELLCHPAALSRPEKFFVAAPGKAGFSGMNGKQWTLERKIAMQALRNVGLGKELWGDIIRNHVQMLLDDIAAEKGASLDLREHLSRAAMSSMFSLLLGGPRASEMGRDEFKAMLEGNETFKDYFKNIAIAAFFPWLLKYLIKFNIGEFEKRKKIVDEFEDKLRALATEILMSEDKEGFTDYIKQHVRETKRQKGLEKIDDHTMECLVGNIAAFMGSSDTAIIAMQWILYLMTSDHEIQDKVQEEIDTAIERGAVIRWEDRRKLPYTMACIHETLRWAAVIPLYAPRCASETFHFNGYTIHKGTVIICNSWAVNRDPKYWDHPDEYIPDRFLQDNVERLMTLEGYAPFSFGKRNCPGDRISMVIIFLLFTGIMQKFTVRTPTGEPPDLEPFKYNSTVEPKNQSLCFSERE